MEKLDQVLKEQFGYTTFRTGQREIIEDVLQGENVLGVLPTGAGKSICYLLPGYLFTGAVVIVSPLVSLMEDQVQQIKVSGEKRVVAINSFQSAFERKKTLQHISAYRFIFISPEMLQADMVIRALQRIKVSLFVIDEAHCISQWGHEFRTDYLKLSDTIDLLRNPPVLALTATASEEVQQDIIQQLKVHSITKHIYSIDRKNIAFKIEKLDNHEDKVSRLLDYIKDLQGPGLVYFSSRVMAENMAELIRSTGHDNCACYHGGMENEDRMLIQQQFLAGQLDLICCTTAFGMGVNKADIRYVIHFHYPTRIESYLQEVGRAGRDQKHSIAILLYTDQDHDIPRHLISREFPDTEDIQRCLYYLQQVHGRLTRQIEHQMLEDLMFDEVKWRFLKHQLEKLAIIQVDQLNLDEDISKVLTEINNKIKRRVYYKQKKWMEVRNFLEADQCRRESLLHFFNEELKGRPDNCCDYCKFDLTPYLKREFPTASVEFSGWKDELKRIFLIQ